jgi:choline transport protein
MVSANIIFLQTSCVIPQAIVLWRGRNHVLPERYFSLGRYGPIVNIISILWVLFVDVISCLPTVMPPAPANMNYVSVVCVGLVLFVIILWFFSKKKTFKGPKIDMEKMLARRMAAMHADSEVAGI